MNHQNWKSLERVRDRLENRSTRTARKVTPASLALVAGLFLGYLLLTRVIPPVWPVLLAADPEQSLTGWPLLIWKAAEFTVVHDTVIFVGLLLISLTALISSYRMRLIRPLVWVAALSVVVTDAGILASTILACLDVANATL